MAADDFIKFVETDKISVTRRVNVVNKGSNVVLGVIKWYGPWRQYCFFTTNAIFNPDCLARIASECSMMTTAHRKERKT